MSAAYEKVKGGKLSFKSGAGAGEKEISKKKKRKKKQEEAAATLGDEPAAAAPAAGEAVKPSEQGYELDTGIGHAPDGKKSKKYEELFPVETKRFGYDAAAAADAASTREAALDARVKKKADRYCK